MIQKIRVFPKKFFQIQRAVLKTPNPNMAMLITVEPKMGPATDGEHPHDEQFVGENRPGYKSNRQDRLGQEWNPGLRGSAACIIC